MSFWSTDFMERRRKEWLDSLVKFQYKVGGVWYDATINTKRITGTKLEVIVSFPRVSAVQQTITAVRIIDVTGQQCAVQSVNVVRKGTQGVLTKYEFPIYEKEGES